MQQQDCIFCKIVRREIPACVVYEDENLLAFLDLSPIHEGHTLLIPKVHYETVLDVPESTGALIVPALRHIGRAIIQATNAGGFNVLQNNFPIAGQVVPHVHWHLIPRFEGDQLKFWPQGKYSSKDHMQQVAAKIGTYL